MLLLIWFIFWLYLIKVYEIKFSSDNILYFMEIKVYIIIKKEENWIFCINIYICMNWYIYYILVFMIVLKMYNFLVFIYFSDFVNKKFIGYYIF